MQIFNLTSDRLLAHVRCKGILEIWSNLESAQFMIGLGVTRCQFTSKVGYVLLIDRK